MIDVIFFADATPQTEDKGEEGRGTTPHQKDFGVV